MPAGRAVRAEPIRLEPKPIAESGRAPNMAAMVAPPDTPPPTRQTPAATVFFVNQSAEITAAAKAELAQLAKSLKGVQQVELRGYATGDDPVDGRKIALARVLVVRSYLIDLGVKLKGEIYSSYLPPSAGATEYVDIFVPGH
jgi:outer membrane protein OmpA-like peptidoglycan-associated protein